jgi:predicted nuclease of predicted toxin-antitoxin system
MKIVVDENVSYGLVERLRIKGHEVTSISELAEKRRLSDEDVYTLILGEQAIFVTRDHHFTDPIRFPAEKTKGIIYIRHGNLKSDFTPTSPLVWSLIPWTDWRFPLHRLPVSFLIFSSPLKGED